MIDKYTKIDDLLRQQNKLLGQMAGVNLEEGDVNVLKALLDIQKHREERELEIVFFTYPPEGEKATLGVGTTLIDFEAGTVTTPAGVVSSLKHSLQSEGKTFLRSFYVNTDKTVKIQVDAKDMIHAEEEKDVVGTYQQFKTMRIMCTEDTETFVLCCTNPEAVLQLHDKPSLVSGGNRQVFGIVIDTDGTGTQFEGKAGGGGAGADAIGDTPVSFVTLTPSTTRKFRITNVRYYCNPSNAETYQLYLFEKASATDIENLSEMIFDSGSGQVDSTSYIIVDSKKLPIDVTLTDTGKLYFLVDWTGDPGNTPGYLVVRGELMA